MEKQERKRQMTSRQVGVFDDTPFDESCFGKMFDLTQAECQYCANQSFCGNKHFRTLPSLETASPFLDEACLDVLDRDEVVANIVGKLEMFALIYIKTKGKVTQALASAYLEVLCKEKGLIIKNGVIKNG